MAAVVMTAVFSATGACCNMVCAGKGSNFTLEAFLCRKSTGKEDVEMKCLRRIVS